MRENGKKVRFKGIDEYRERARRGFMQDVLKAWEYIRKITSLDAYRTQ